MIAFFGDIMDYMDLKDPCFVEYLSQPCFLSLRPNMDKERQLRPNMDKERQLRPNMDK